MLHEKRAQEDRATNLRDNTAQKCCVAILYRKTAQQTYATMPRKNAASLWLINLVVLSSINTVEFLSKKGAIKKTFLLLYSFLSYFFILNEVRD